MNSFGRMFRVEIYGESHGPEVGILLDGVPAGIALCEADFAADLARRRPGEKGTTTRCEADLPIIRSGVYQGHTTGAPILIGFSNGNVRSEDYEAFGNVPRPGHADMTRSVKFGALDDPRGGGTSSGRLSVALVAAGVVAKKILPKWSFAARLVEVGGIPVDLGGIPVEVGGESADLPSWKANLEKVMAEGDSLGGVVECVVETEDGASLGLGEPFFDSVESVISHLIFSIPGVRGIEFGDGFAAARMKGSEHNDVYASATESDQGKADSRIPVTNGSGGVNGGIANGNPIVFRVAFKPTSTIGKEQKTHDFADKADILLKGRGRHDACFALRTPVIVEACAAMAFADFWLISSEL